MYLKLLFSWNSKHNIKFVIKLNIYIFLDKLNFNISHFSTLQHVCLILLYIYYIENNSISNQYIHKFTYATHKCRYVFHFHFENIFCAIVLRNNVYLSVSRLHLRKLNANIQLC